MSLLSAYFFLTPFYSIHGHADSGSSQVDLKWLEEKQHEKQKHISEKVDFDRILGSTYMHSSTGQMSSAVSYYLHITSEKLVPKYFCANYC